MKIGLLGLAFLIMLGLKLAGVTTISWWIVFAPLLVVPVITLTAVFVAGVFAAVKIIKSY